MIYRSCNSCNSSTGSKTQDYRRKLQAKSYLLGVKTNLIKKDLLTRSKELFNYQSTSSSSDTSLSSFTPSMLSSNTESQKSAKLNTTSCYSKAKKVSFGSTDKVRYIHPPYKIQNEIISSKKEKENSVPTSPSRSTLEKSTTVTNSFSNNSQTISSPSHISSDTTTNESIENTKPLTKRTITKIENENMKLTIKSPKVNIRIKPLQDILNEQKNINNKLDKSETIEESSTSSFYTSFHHTPSSIICNGNNSNPLEDSSNFISTENISNQNPSFFKNNNSSLYSFQALHSLKLREAILHYNRTLCRKIFLHWKIYTDNRMIKNEINDKINNIINIYKKKKFINKWKERSDYLIRKRNIYNEIKNISRKNKLKLIFKNWKVFKNNEMLKKNNIIKAEKFKRMKSLHYYFVQWKKYHLKQFHKKKNMNKVIKYINKCNKIKMKDIFINWKLYYIKRKNINEIYMKLYNKKRNFIIGKYYKHWSDVHGENKFVTNKYVEIKLRNFFTQWKDYVFDRRLDRYYYQNRMKSTLRYWKGKKDKILKLNRYYIKFKKNNEKKVKDQIFNYWNRISKIQTHENKRIKRIIKEKKKKIIKKYFQEWKRVSKIEALKQRQVVEYQLHIQKFKLKNIFTKWKNYVNIKKIKEKNEFKIIRLYTKNLKKKIFKFWKERYQKNKRRRVIIYILKFIQKRYYIHQWFVNVKMIKKERKLTKKSLQFYYQNLLNKYFNHWKFNSIINKHLLLCNKKAISYNKYRLLWKYFMKFRVNVNDKIIEKENKKIAVMFNNHYILRTYFKRYIKIVEYLKYQKINYYKAIQFHNNNLLPHYYHKWINYIFYRFKKVEKYKKCDKYYKKVLLLKGLNKLFKNKENRIFIKIELNNNRTRNFELYKMNKYLQILYEYKELKKYQKQVNDQAKLFYNLKILKVIFYRWNLYINKTVKERNRVIKLNYLRKWKYNIEDKKHENEMINICNDYYNNNLLKKMIKKWKRYKLTIIQIKEERKEIEKENFIKNIFNEWKRYVKYKINKEEMIKRADLFNKEKKLKNVIIKLKENLNRKKNNKNEIEMSLKYYINRKLEMSLNKWIEYRNKSNKNRNEMLKLLKESSCYYNEKKMRYYLLELYKYSIENKRIRKLRKIILFRRWKNITNQIKVENLKVKKVTIYHNNNLKYNYFKNWINYLKYRNMKMKRNIKIDNYYNNKQKLKIIKKLYNQKIINKNIQIHNIKRILKIGFLHWKKYHNRKLYIKKKEIECINYYNNNHKFQLRKYFNLLVKYTNEKMKMKYLESRIVILNRRKKILSNMFDHWLSLRNSKIRLKYSVFIKWYKVLEESKKEKNNELKAIKYYNNNQKLKFVEKLSDRIINKKQNIIKMKEAKEWNEINMKKRYLYYWKYKVINMWLESNKLNDFVEICNDEDDNEYEINKSITKIKIKT